MDNQEAYIVGFRVDITTYTYTPNLETGGWDLAMVLPRVEYWLTRTNNPDLFAGKEINSYAQLKILGLERVISQAELLTSEEGVYNENLLMKTETTSRIGFENEAVAYPSHNDYVFNSYYVEFSTTYHFKNFTFDALQDVGYTTGESGETRDATKKDGYITQEYQNMQILDKIYGQCDCDKTYNPPPHVPNLDEVIYQTTLDDLSAKTVSSTYSSNLDSMGTESIIESEINKSSHASTHLLTKMGNQDTHEDFIINSSDMYLILKSKLELVILEEPIETGGQLSNIALQV